MVEVVWDNIKVEFWDAGEGYNGDYNEDDPEDVALLRFDVQRFATVDDRLCEVGLQEWQTIDDASYCTQVPVDTDGVSLTELAMIIMANVYDHASAGISIKKRCEELSWISPSWLARDSIVEEVPA